MTEFINDGRLPEEQPGQEWGADGMRFAASALHANQCALERGGDACVVDAADLEPIPTQNQLAGILAVTAAPEGIPRGLPLRSKLQALSEGFQNPNLPTGIAELLRGQA